MKKAARAIVLHEDKILLMKRHKMGKEYYTLLGGRVEQGETPEQSALREVKEESTVDIADPRLVFIEDAGEPYGLQYIYLCSYVQGNPMLPQDSEEAYWTIPDKNTYEPVWLRTSQLNEVAFVSPLLREAIIMGLKSGWPSKPYEFSSRHAKRLS